MRPHGSAEISAAHPRALAVCDRCGKLTNLDRLQWQFDYRGPRLVNLRLLVCRPCLDVPQEQLRTVVLPMDPVPIANARPENYVAASSPLSAVGYDVNNLFLPISQRGGAIGTLTFGGGVDAAFDGNAAKPAAQSAALAVSNSSFNTVGKNWGADPSGITATLASTVAVQTHVVASFVATAPNDQPFLRGSSAISYFFQGSANNATWTTLSSGTTAGSVGEALTVTSTATGPFQFHRLALIGDGVGAVAVAQLALTVSDGFQGEI